ncbi:MAG: hypothetical protein R3A45_07090 [Bdellovibrionota bacterium]
MTTNQPPFSSCTTPGAGCTPSTLAESYLNITNFIADDGTNYVDRDFGNDDYLAAVPWFDYTVPGHTTNYYNSPSALDLMVISLPGRLLSSMAYLIPNTPIKIKKAWYLNLRKPSYMQ